ncbi:hypothetical protein [Saccharospirillum impatiens]|uniref:hypothetical protein n=1 Tax=Saccharospirillum impatiens TaxID=169438 RepID=UPI0003FE6E70|nr:hypothetical protein [Saccharospirillum impatiens]
MQLILKLVGLSALTLLLVGCENAGNGGGNADNGDDNDDTVMFVEFADFVKSEINNTPANSDATPINDLMFDFNNRTNASAFDDVL